MAPVAGCYWRENSCGSQVYGGEAGGWGIDGVTSMMRLLVQLENGAGGNREGSKSQVIGWSFLIILTHVRLVRSVWGIRGLRPNQPK